MKTCHIFAEKLKESDKNKISTMKRLILIIGLFSIVHDFSASAQKFEHGLILGGGGGSLSNVKFAGDVTSVPVSEYKFNIALGYKFRLNCKTKPFFYDFDLSVGMKKHNYSIWKNAGNPGDIFIVGKSSKSPFLYTSLNTTFNYKIYKGLYAGAGVEPAIYTHDDPKEFLFDIPLTAKIGYDLKFAGLSFGYKCGLLNPLKADHNITKGRMNDWQFQLFIPF
jgi:hypothetical protein